MKILVTGAAGFIGSKLMYALRQRGDEVVGIDNYNVYYDVRLKEGRCRAFGLDVRRMDIADKAAVDALFGEEKFDKVVNLAAQAGVRYSIVIHVPSTVTPRVQECQTLIGHILCYIVEQELFG